MWVRVCLLALMGPIAASAESLPIQVDGEFDDWDTEFVGDDVTGDAGASGIDFTELFLANDDVRLFIQFDTTAEIQGDEQQELVLALDTDQNSSTGWLVGGIGAELEWRLGERMGFEHVGGSASEIDHPDIGLMLAPTVSNTRLELGIDRDAVIDGQPLFPGDSFDIYLFDADNGDAIGPFSYSFAAGSQPVPSIALERENPNHLRIGSYNVKNDGLFDGGATASAFGRLLNAAGSDVWIFSEVWDHSAAEVVARLDTLQPAPGGSSWDAVKMDTGNVVASTLPVLDSWLVSPGDRLTAVLLDARPRYDSDILVIANHWSCCTADDNRQRQADALIAFIRDAQTPGGTITLAVDTPIVAGGDFNLVGWRQQLDTAITGDIDDNGTYGPDFAPDWDGSDFDRAAVRQVDARLTYTWRNDFSSFYPGKLDYLFYTGSVAVRHNGYILETRTMAPSTLATYGLQAADTGTASDHGPVVADFSVGTVVGVPDGYEPKSQLEASPNPFSAAATLSLTLDDAAEISVDIFDVAGRHVRHVGGGSREAGRHSFTWDGLNAGGAAVPPGVYLAKVSGPEPATLRLILSR